MIIGGVILASFDLSCGKTPPEKAMFMPSGSQLTIAIERRPMHPFLTEYHRILILSSEEKEISHWSLFPDTGGTVLVNAFMLPGRVVRLVDRLESYEIVLNSQAVAQKTSEIQHESQGVFLGAFDFSKKEGWRFLSSDERKQMIIPGRMLDGNDKKRSG